MTTRVNTVVAKNLEPDQLRELARMACYEIQNLASMTRELIDNDEQTERSVSYVSILARIVALSDVVHEAARLGPDPDQTPDLRRLSGVFEGRGV